jgi:4a-hydroxytetrahydrobiopterin dehydratase
MVDLKEKKCVPCEGGVPPLGEKDIRELLEQLPPDWKVTDNKKISKTFQFEDFKRGMAFAQEIARVAELENHHPDICISYKEVNVELSTHAINGLSENDFILAAKIENL